MYRLLALRTFHFDHTLLANNIKQVGITPFCITMIFNMRYHLLTLPYFKVFLSITGKVDD